MRTVQMGGRIRTVPDDPFSDCRRIADKHRRDMQTELIRGWLALGLAATAIYLWLALWPE